MYESYEDAVLDAADDDGNLTEAQALKLFADHSSDLKEWLDSVDAELLGRYSAEGMLSWLGY
jgi:hypothetical protein